MFDEGKEEEERDEVVVREEEEKKRNVCDLQLEFDQNKNKTPSHSQASLGLAAIAVCEGITSEAAWADEERKPAKSTSARKSSEVIFDIFSVSLFKKKQRRGLERVRRKELCKLLFFECKRHREMEKEAAEEGGGGGGFGGGGGLGGEGAKEKK